MAKRGVLFLITCMILLFGISISSAERYIVEVDENFDYGNLRQKGGVRVGLGDNRIVIENVSKDKLEKLDGVHKIEPDYKIHKVGEVTPWNFEVIGINFSEIDGEFGKRVKIAVFDTGVNFNLVNIYSGYDFVNEDSDASDDNGHGTFVSQILRSVGDGRPLFGSEIYSVKVLDFNGEGYVSDVLEAIDWAIDNNIDIVLMSFSGEGDSFFLKYAIDIAYSAGILFIAASGNYGMENVEYPAAYESVIAVGSINNNMERSSFSNFGAELEFVAPGENILVTDGIDFYLGEGTSFSVPHAGVVAASFLSGNISKSNKEIREIMQSSALDLGQLGRDNEFGFGLVRYNKSMIHGICKPREEICNNKDDDCDGLIDEEINELINGADIGECRTEIMRCVDGSFQIIQSGISVVDEICYDDKDNDCDSIIDDGCVSRDAPIIHSPANREILKEKKVLINVSVNRVVEYIKYQIDGNKRRNGEDVYSALCRNCNHAEKIISFWEGNHTLRVITSNNIGERFEDSVDFFIDSKKPDIARTFPRKNAFTNGSDFSVEYDEDNLRYARFFWNSNFTNVSRSNCASGRDKECRFNIDISRFNGQEILYWLELEDIAGNKDISDKKRVFVDSVKPIIKEFNYSIKGARVRFFVKIEELNFERVEYIDYQDRVPRWRNLCTRLKDGICEVSKIFRSGVHKVEIRVRDKAGNFVGRIVELNLS